MNMSARKKQRTNMSAGSVPTLQSIAIDGVAKKHNQARLDLSDRHAEEMKALKNRHDKEVQDLNTKLAEEKKTLLTGKCFSCGKGVDGSPPFGKYAFDNYHASMCAYCRVTRKCPDCKWPVECAYNDMNKGKHGYCSFCKDSANICQRCDGGCYACQRDNGCCAYNGGYRRGWL